ncbi:hypothetical protein ACLOJK_029554, partial [Asimina triloba]
MPLLLNLLSQDGLIEMPPFECYTPLLLSSATELNSLCCSSSHPSFPFYSSFRPTVNEQTARLIVRLQACLVDSRSENSSARNPSTPPAPLPAPIVGVFALPACLFVGIVNNRSASADLKTHRHPVLGPTDFVLASAALANSHRLSSIASAVVENPAIRRLHQRAPASTWFRSAADLHRRCSAGSELKTSSPSAAGVFYIIVGSVEDDTSSQICLARSGSSAPDLHQQQDQTHRPDPLALDPRSVSPTASTTGSHRSSLAVRQPLPVNAARRQPPSPSMTVRWIPPLGKKVEHHNTLLQRYTYFGTPSASFGTPAEHEISVHPQ